MLGKGTSAGVWQRFGTVQCAPRDKLAWAADVWNKPSDSCIKCQRPVGTENVCHHQGSTAGDPICVFAACTRKGCRAEIHQRVSLAGLKNLKIFSI